MSDDEMEQVVDAAKEAIDKLASVEAGLGKYIDALDDVIAHAHTLRRAAQDDWEAQR